MNPMTFFETTVFGLFLPANSRHVGAKDRSSVGNKPIVYRLMVPLAVILVFAVAGFGVVLTRLQGDHLNQKSLDILQNSMGEMAESMAEQSRYLDALGQVLLENPSLSGRLGAGDREGLLSAYAPVFADLKRIYGLTHLYFHRSDRVNLLRVHKPDKYGDHIDRFTALEAQRTGKTAAGIELGPLGTFTLRSVQPVWADGRCIGYMELGKEIEDILSTIHGRRGVELVVVIHKDLLDRPLWEAGMAMLGRPAQWDQFADDVLIYNSIPVLKAQWQRFMADSVRHPDHIIKEKLLDDRTWHFMVRPLRDVGGAEAGALILLHDISADQLAFNRLMVSVVSIAAVALALLLLFIYTIVRHTDRHIRSQQAHLVDSERRYKQLAAFLPLSLFETDIQGNVVFANPFALQATGYCKADIRTGLNVMQVIHFQDREIAAQRTSQVLQGIYAEGAEYLVQRKDGSTFPAHINTRPSLRDGEPVGLTGYIFDLTERKAAEKALQESEAKFRVLIENTPDVITRFDDQCRLLYASPAMENHFDVDPSDLMGKRLSDFSFPDQQVAFWETAIQNVFTSGAPIETEFDIQGKNGVVTFNWRLVPELEDNQVKTVMSIARDITLQKKTEKKYSTLFNKMMDGFALHEVICNPDGVPVDYLFLTVNPAFEQMTGLRAEAITGKRVLEVLPDTEKFWIDTFGQVALTGEPVTFENYSQAIDRYFEVTAYQPEPSQFATIFQDVTERKRAKAERDKLEAQLQQALKMESIGTLAGGIAHDFNNILFPIIGFVEMMLETAEEGSDLWENLNEVLIASLRARDLVQQILAFSRQAEKELKPLKVQTIVEEVLKLMRASLPSTIKIEPKIDPDCGRVLADPSHIQQITMNLLTNAYHAMENQGGVVTVSVSDVEMGPEDQGHFDLRPGAYVRLTVADTGTGIDATIITRLFEPYFTTKEQGKGTGLGLSVVHGIVKSYNGDIRVYSEPGNGTVFHVYLPQPKVTSGQVANENETVVVRGNGEHILLVDDEEAILTMEKKMLERLGYRVTMQTGSLAGLEAFRASPRDYDLIITDMTMPDMTGDKLASLAKEIHKDIPVVLCTGFSNIISEDKARAMGIDTLLMKPVVQSDLSITVRRLLDGNPLPVAR